MYVAALGAILECDNIPILKKATSALMGISIDVEAKIKVMEQCGTTLLQLMKHADQDIADNAKATILNCCEKPEVSSMIKKTLSAAEREFFLGPLPIFARDIDADLTSK